MKPLTHSMTFASPLNKFLVIFEPQLVVVCCCLVTKSYPTLCDPMDCSLGLLHCRQTLYCLSYKGKLKLQPARLLCPWNFPGKNTGVGCRFLVQRIFPTQGLNPHLLRWQAGSLPLSHQGSPYCSPYAPHHLRSSQAQTKVCTATSLDHCLLSPRPSGC